ncbi:hypothetical protein AB6E89_12525 [Vibrio breoganii]
MRVLCFLLMLFVLPVHAESFKFEKDKALHLGFSTVIGAGASYIAADMGVNSRGVDYSVCMAFGFAKEAIDERRYGGWSNYDLAYDALGCVIGIESSRLFQSYIPKETTVMIYPSSDGFGADFSYRF